MAGKVINWFLASAAKLMTNWYTTNNKQSFITLTLAICITWTCLYQTSRVGLKNRWSFNLSKEMAINTEQTLSSSCRSLYMGNPCLCSSIVKFVFFPYDALFPPNVARFHSGMSSFASPTPRISWAKIGLSPFTKQEGQNYDDYPGYTTHAQN